jgi:hypothetical protein
MSGKPRKAFDGVGRPQGFIDDAAKVLLKASKRVVNMGKKGEASMLSPMSKKKFDRIYGKGSAKQVAEQTKKNAYRSAPPKPKELPSIKGKSPRPMPSKPNPRAQTTAEMDESLRVDARLRAAIKPKTKPERRMSPYYKTSKNSRNYRG